MTARSRFILSSAMVLTAVLPGCAKKDEEAKEGTSGLARLALANAESALNGPALTSQTATTYTPDSFGVKMLTVRLTPDIDANMNPVGVSPAIWANPACTIKTSETTVDEDDGQVAYGYSSVEDPCTDDMVTTYFELARPSDEVNADLNSQALKVLPGTYKYVSIDFCKNGPQTNNISFDADGMPGASQVKLGTCGVNSVEAVPPIEIGEGEAVVVALAYSLANIVYDYGEGMSASDNCYFSDDGSVRRCVNFPVLSPSFSKAE